MQSRITKAVVEIAAGLALLAPTPWAYALAFGRNPATTYVHRVDNQTAPNQRAQTNSGNASTPHNRVRCTSQTQGSNACQSNYRQAQQPKGTH